MINQERLTDEVMWRGGIGERPRAEAALAAALRAMAGHLGTTARTIIAEQLPPAFAPAIRQPEPFGPREPNELHSWLAASEKISVGRAVEHVHAACSALADLLDEDTRSLLARRLPPEWAALFTPVPSATEADIAPGTLPAHGHTLATGRPGSRHPLAEAAPRAAQADSVVTAENPHGESKLSSATEPAETTRLATARPGAEYPIAQAKDERPGR